MAEATMTNMVTGTVGTEASAPAEAQVAAPEVAPAPVEPPKQEIGRAHV